MSAQLRFAADMRDRAEIARFRREVRTINLSRSGHDPDNAADPRTDGATLCAWSGGDVVGALDVHWGGEHPLPGERSQEVGVAEIAGPDSDARQIVVLDEAIVHPDWQSTGLEQELKHAAVRYAASRRARWVFTTCVPREISSYRLVGFKPSGLPSSDRDHGTRLPVVLDLADVDVLAALKSPFAPASRQGRGTRPDDDEGAAPRVRPEAARPSDTKPAESTPSKPPVSFLSGLSGSTRTRLLALGMNVRPARGEALVRQGERGRELFLVVRGTVEARKNGHRVAVLGPGEVFGEVGFLMEQERTADVVAASDDVIALKMTHESLSALMNEQPEVAASLTMGIAQGLCLKLMARP